MKFKKYFESLSGIQKIEMYLIILMTYALVFIFYETLLAKAGIDLTHKQVIIKNGRSTQVNFNSMKHMELLQYIGRLNDEFDISLINTQILKKSIELKFEGSFNSIVNTLKEFQNKFIIKEFEIKKESNVISVTVVLDIRYIFNDKSKQVVYTKIYKPFNKEAKKKKKVYEDIKVSAIIGKEVLISGQWYKENDTVTKYKIVKINKENVMLLDNVTKGIISKKVDYE